MSNTLKRCNNYLDLPGRADLKTRLYSLVENAKDKVYVLAAEQGSDKELWANAIASHILCLNPDSNGACKECNSCRYLEASTNPDIKILEPESKGKNIPIKSIREDINAEIFLRPQISNNRVWVIDGNAIREDAQNSLLKDLEEPPTYAYFVIYIDDKTRLLPTLRSRAIEIDLPRLSDQELEDYLNSHGILDPDKKRLAMNFSSGLAKLALDLANNEELLGLRQNLFKNFINFLSHDASDILTVDFDYWNSIKDDVQVAFQFLLSFLRDWSLIVGEGDKKLDSDLFMNDDYIDYIRKVQKSRDLSVSNLSESIAIINDTDKKLKANSNFEMTINAMLLRLGTSLS